MNHGTYASYAHGCRCPPCRVAKREYGRRWRDNGGREYQRLWHELRKPAEASPEVISTWKERIYGTP